MPELPEVERVRLTLAPILATRRIHGVRLHRRDIANGAWRSRDLLAGADGLRLDRRGKRLAVIASDGRTLAVHLGMTGQFFWAAPGTHLERADHVHAEWSLRTAGGEPAGRLIFRDPRRFGGLWAFPTVEAHDKACWAPLGPDALAIDGDALRERLVGSGRAIKAALLDQAVLAGVGNIYADESLFRARLSPLTPAGSLGPQACERLAAAIRAILRDAIDAGGSSLRDYRDGAGQAGAYQKRHLVYGRAGEACRICGRTLRCEQVAQRTTVWCGRCQSAGPKLPR